MKEIRFNELRLKEEDGRTIEGTAIVFDSESELLYGEFREVIKRESVSDELINNSDIFMLYNHNNDNGVLARSKHGKGTLKIDIDERGVHYSFIAPNSRLGNDMLESVKRGDINSSSFAFMIDSDGENWEKRGDSYLRTITRFKTLHDFSIVPIPAYAETKVNKRGLEELKEDENAKSEEARKELEKQLQIQRENEIEMQRYIEDKRKKYII